MRVSGFQEVQRGLKVYKGKKGPTEKSTAEQLTDIDIVARTKDPKKVIICELKNWDVEVPQSQIQQWVQNRLNVILDYFEKDLDLKSEVEAWFVVSKKQSIDENEIRKISKCKIRILSKLELVDDVIGRMNPFLAKELRPIVLY